jgi:molybdate transport system substrate-binding protein
MLNKTMKQLMPAAASAALLISAGVEAHATTINIAVASNFYGTNYPTTSAIADIISAFDTANPGYSVVIAQNGSSGTLENQITGGNALNVDLFLAADQSHPLDLYNNHPTLVDGIPFDYAVGTLAFWSNASGVHAENGYSTGGYTSVAAATPTLAPYGEATLELLDNQFSGTGTYPSTFVVYTNIDLVYNAVNLVTQPAGFVALSSVCINGAYPSKGSVRVYPAGEFTPTGTLTNYSGTVSNKGTYKNNTNAIIQAGIPVLRPTASPRTTAQETELQAFISYLSSSSTTSTLTKYCYAGP